MKLKSNFHFHSSEDPYEKHLDYTFKEAIDYAAQRNFQVLAITLHGTFGYTKELSRYAQEKNILLVPGIEQFIENKHVLILGCQKDIEQVQTFAELRKYKKENPQICIIAPHPYFPGRISLQQKLAQNQDLFDAIEKSWFYTRWIDQNKKAQAFAQKLSLPYLATSDTHFLKYLNNAFANIEVSEKTIPAVLGAIKAGNFQNETRPVHFWKDMVWQIGTKEVLRRPWRLYLTRKKQKRNNVEQKIRSFVPPAGIEPTSKV